MHRFKAKTRHGLHSPFVYRLVDNIFYDYRAKKVYHEIEKINNDLPATRKSFTSGLTKLKINRLLYRLVADLKPGNLLLLGTIPAITLPYLQKGSTAAKVYTTASSIAGKIDFALISGGDEALRYFEDCLPKIHDTTMIVFDGIYQNKNMKKIWQEIKANQQVTVTVDLFWIGLVFFRKGQAKEDFLIKLV